MTDQITLCHACRPPNAQPLRACSVPEVCGRCHDLRLPAFIFDAASTTERDTEPSPPPASATPAAVVYFCSKHAPSKECLTIGFDGERQCIECGLHGTQGTIEPYRLRLNPELPELPPVSDPPLDTVRCFVCYAQINDGDPQHTGYVMPSRDGSGYDPETCRACFSNYQTVRPRQAPARDWLGGGKDGHRLRVKGWKDAEVELSPFDHDPREVAEAHAEYRSAMEAGDDHALGKMFEPVLDEIHTSPSAPEPTPTIPPLDWNALEPALTAEWGEWARSHRVRKNGLALRRAADGGAEVRLAFQGDDGTPFAILQDALKVQTRWDNALGIPRRAAALIVLDATAELHRARQREVVMVLP